MDNLTKEQRKRNMRNIKSVGTKPERIVMRELRTRGYYFAKNVESIEGKPDIVFWRKKVAIFIDSDFWHCNRKYFQMPKTNVSYWRKKIATNVSRDKKVNRILKKNGWVVLRFWESDIKGNSDKCIRKIVSFINKTPLSSIG